MEWQSIETAPRDGTHVLLFLDPPIDSNEACGWLSDDVPTVVGWADGSYRDGTPIWKCGFCSEGSADTEGYSSAIMLEVSPTHWMPLPSPPKPEGSS